MIQSVSPTVNSNLSSNSSMDLSPPALLHVSFNQDSGRFAAGTDRGFRIYTCDPFCEVLRRDFGGIGTIETLFPNNIFALVGDRGNPSYPHNKVMLWDDQKKEYIAVFPLRSEVLGVRLQRDFVIVVFEQKIFVYNFADGKLFDDFPTIPNPKGLCAVSQAAGVRSFVLACPGLQKGQVRVEHHAPKRVTKFIPAHDSAIACLVLSQDGQWLATASQKGTLVRIFNTQAGTLLQEVRRGADRAEIYSLAFSASSSSAQWLAVSSDKGTVHVFRLNTTGTTSSGSSPGFVKGVLPKYFSSEWSAAQFRLPEGSTRHVVGFGHEKNTVVILGMDGSFYRCKFDPVTGGEMTRMEYHNFLKPVEAF